MQATGGADWWTNLMPSPGQFTLAAYAVNNNDISSKTNRITLQADSSLPIICITSHTNGQDCMTKLTISGSASASAGTISSVLCSIDNGVYKPVSGTTSWSYSPVISPGPHTFYFHAIDSTEKQSCEVFLRLNPSGTKYAAALSKAILFYNGNKCGTNVVNSNVFSWRGNCHTADTIPLGFHDAGDHMKFSLPAAYTFFVLGWSLYEFSGSFSSSDKNKLLTDILKNFSDYFIASYDKNSHSFIYQIGDPNIDHAYWAALEMQTGNRPSYTNTQAMGYADSGSFAAAGLALMI